MHQKTLQNGLRVLVMRLPHVHSVSHALLVRGGSRFETPATSGLSHMVEHLLFRGTLRHPDSLSFNVAVEALGGEINGLTQRDAVTIHLTVPPLNALPGLELLGEVVTEPTLEGLAIERHVVMEEILDSLDQDGQDLDADTIARQGMWPNHPMALPIAGTPRTVEGFTEEACRAHFERLFVASNAVLCVAGPVDPEEVFDTAQRAFGAMRRGERLDPGAPPQIAALRPIQIRATDDSQVSLLFSFEAPHENDPDFPALLLLRRLLDDGFGSRLRQAICEQSGLAYSLGACIDAYADAAALDIELACAPRKVRRATEAVLTTLDTLGAVAVTEAELARAKTRHRAEVEFALDYPQELCGWYGAMVLVDSEVDYETRLEQVLNVTAEEIRSLAQRLFRREACLLTLMGPVEEADVEHLEVVCMGRPAGSSDWGVESEAETAGRGEEDQAWVDDEMEVGVADEIDVEDDVEVEVEVQEIRLDSLPSETLLNSESILRAPAAPTPVPFPAASAA